LHLSSDNNITIQPINNMKKNVSSYRLISGAACAGAIWLAASSVPAQNLFVADYSNDNIYQITPGGTATVYTSGMNYPNGIAFDSSGDLFVANTANNALNQGSITEITPGLVQTTFASGIDPQALAFDSMGDLFEADYRSGNIYEYAPGQPRSTFASGFSFPISLTFNTAGDLFVGAGGANNGYITEIAPNKTQTPIASGLSYPQGMAFNTLGDLFVVNNGNGVVDEIVPGGTATPFVTISGANEVAIDGANNLYVGTYASTVVKVTPGGTPSPFSSIGNGITGGLTFQPVPEPSLPSLLGMGGVVFFVCRQARKAKTART
jgi:hypothetical protein